MRFLSFLRSASLFQIPELLTQRKFVSVMIPELLTQRMFVSVKTMGARLLRFGVQSLSFLRSASLFQQRTTPTLTPTKGPKLWLLQF